MLDELPKFGDFRIDLRNKQLFHDGQPIDLRALVFAVLELLYGNLNRLVSYKLLEESLWPAGVRKHTLQQTVGELKRKIDAKQGGARIRNFRNGCVLLTGHYLEITDAGELYRSVTIDSQSTKHDPPEILRSHLASLSDQQNASAPFEGIHAPNGDKAFISADLNFNPVPHWGGIATSPIFVVRKEMAQIDEIYRNRTANVICVTGYLGGEGKTQLIQRWVKQVHEGGAKAPRVFCYSFNSQGMSDVRQTTSTEFFNKAFEWCGLEKSVAPLTEDRAAPLAEAIRKLGVLLYLDGLEPLQEPSLETASRLADEALRELLRQLTVDGPHFCIVSTRRRVTDLDGLPRVTTIELNEMQTHEATALLKEYGVRALTAEEEDSLEDIAKSWNCHPLSLALLGAYVRERNIWEAETIKVLFRERSQDVLYKPHLMLAVHDELLKGSPELQLLRTLGLFDRPVSDTVVWLLTNPPIEGLSDLARARPNRFPHVLQRLTDLNLLIVDSGPANKMLHCHPLVRQYQSEKMRAEMLDSWNAANERLFGIFSGMVKHKQPDLPDDILLLYRAIEHGCAAGLYKSAFELYWDRVSRQDERFASDKLGLVDADLRALGAFAEKEEHLEWTHVSKDLSGEQRRLILDLISFRLRTLGRLTQAEPVLRQALAEFKDNEDWRNASNQANNLAVMLRMQGRLREALNAAEDALAYAKDNVNDESLVVHRLAALGEIHHYLGNDQSARTAFEEAESMQVPGHRPYLRSTIGFRYCEFLLNADEPETVLERASVMRVQGTAKYSLLDEALQYLCEGRGKLLLADGRESKVREAEELLERSFALAQQSSHRDNRIRAAIAWSEALRARNELSKAQSKLERAKYTAEEYGMYLHALDCDYGLLELRKSARLDAASLIRDASELGSLARSMSFGLLVNKIEKFISIT